MPESYDPANIFARMLRHEIPYHAILDDEAVLAFMDIMPRTDGHCLVIPKAPARTLLDITPDDLAALMLRVQRVARAAVSAMGADGFTIQQFNEAAGGQEVFHLHVHVLPRRAGSAIRPPGGPVADPALLARQAEAIRAALDKG